MRLIIDQFNFRSMDGEIEQKQGPQTPKEMDLFKFRRANFKAIDRIGAELEKSNDDSLGATAYLHRKREGAGDFESALTEDEIRDAYQNWEVDQAEHNKKNVSDFGKGL